jgi:NADPH:quinone reductase
MQRITTVTEATRIIVRKAGGPDVLETETVTLPAPGAREVLVRHEAIGLNFIDTYHRSGLYPLEMPTGLGGEAAGTIEAVGPDVTDFAAGDRVAYAAGALGAYATARIISVDKLVHLPEEVDARTAAAVMLKGMTVDMLVGECGEAKAGQWVLVHAAAGGVGSLAVQWLSAIGARVIAHAGSPEKAEKARQLGAEAVLSCSFDELAEQVRALTDGQGVELVLDGVGKASWDASLKSAARRGLLVTYGNASGPVPAVEPLALSRSGSLFLTRPTLFDYIDTRPRLEAAAGRLFAMLESGKLEVEIGQTFALADAAEAHRALEARETTGSTILLP